MTAVSGASFASLSPCPCDSGFAYAECCGRFHSGALHLAAPDAATLMRSRYSAFVLGLNDYILATWHASTRPAQLEAPPSGHRWIGLNVRRHEADAGSAPEHATVEFIARGKVGGRAYRLHEVSRFVREGGRWFYVDGELQ
jgi:SEC-C motif domain protein